MNATKSGKPTKSQRREMNRHNTPVYVLSASGKPLMPTRRNGHKEKDAGITALKNREKP